MPHHMTGEPASVQRKQKSPPPAVSVRIGGTRFEMDRIPRPPRWLATLLTSAVITAAAFVTHHLHYWK